MDDTDLRQATELYLCQNSDQEKNKYQQQICVSLGTIQITYIEATTELESKNKSPSSCCILNTRHRNNYSVHLIVVLHHQRSIGRTDLYGGSPLKPRKNAEVFHITAYFTMSCSMKDSTSMLIF